MQRPTLTIFAGPNGAGKSTLIRGLLSSEMLRAPIIDPDAIKVEIGPGATELQAGRTAIERCRALIEQGETFTRETTLSGNEPLRLMSRAKSNDYWIALYYVCNDSLDNLKDRVAIRAKLGGHDIPIDAQNRRYLKSLMNLRKATAFADQTICLDNSGASHRVIATRKASHFTFHAPAPDWLAKAGIVPVQRLQVRKQFLAARKGVSERRKSIVIQAARRPGAPAPHIGEGFTATKKVGNAVIRNTAKRRLRAASGQLLPRLGKGGADYVFIARHNTADIAFSRLLDDMESALISVADKI